MSVIRFGAYEAHLAAGELHKRGLKIKLQVQPFQLLAYLLEHPGDVVSREELRLALWPADTHVEFDNSLNSAVGKLRRALGDSSTNPRFIETLPGRDFPVVLSFLHRRRPAPSALPPECVSSILIETGIV